MPHTPPGSPRAERKSEEEKNLKSSQESVEQENLEKSQEQPSPQVDDHLPEEAQQEVPQQQIPQQNAQPRNANTFFGFTPRVIMCPQHGVHILDRVDENVLVMLTLHADPELMRDIAFLSLIGALNGMGAHANPNSQPEQEEEVEPTMQEDLLHERNQQDSEEDEELNESVSRCLMM
ncbi:hypothetical protein [Fluoribacter dumoffii]|uniref:hypothetical protein n=1 Tax=Fluoribacter dumoffii TaxID=463 RepID=UPI00026C7A29|nr:hypothetical protein [Fluoribacter dumoffii]